MHVDVANISKAMVCPYYGYEIPKYQELGLDPDRIYQLYRDPAELAAAADTFKRIPLLIIHKAVSAEEPEQMLVVGCTGDNVSFELPYLKASLSVWTDEAIKLIESKSKEELSCGYYYRCDLTPGVADGVPYDGVMRDMYGNHVAIVEEGRCGPDVIVPDELPTELKHMRRTKLIAALASFFKPDADLIAVDAVIKSLATSAADSDLTDKEKKDAEDAALAIKRAGGAADAELTDEEKEEAREKAKDKKAKDKAAKDAKDAKAAKDAARRARDDDPDHREDFSEDAQTVTVDQMNAAIATKSKEAVKEAIARTEALHAARREVEPVCGHCALDSADAVYAYALKQLGVETKDIHASAYPAMLKMAREKRAVPDNLGMDSAGDAGNDADAIFGDLSRLRS